MDVSELNKENNLCSKMLAQDAFLKEDEVFMG